MLGQADDLGGGVYMKRLNGNLLFAKKDRASMDGDELLAFRLLAKSYAGLTETQVGQLVAAGDFVEICHDDKTKIQK